ncbi:lysophospholipase [Brachybacterium phenoliresistens]|uniref:Lysophospholipase n=1 Tax=Brachybacterium phenoliresistens TaxID=396014 RepID=Z9JPK9_9MICO|nr:GDSL-type esterase/lipase family protein [Brachybacterium phenoliresistens]EWS79682.1 lysophospholipase [Brachybacterium phenoliresistens]
MTSLTPSSSSSSSHPRPGRRSVLLGMGVASLGAMVAAPAAADGPTRGGGTALRLDFGPGAVAPGFQQVTAQTAYSAERGFGFADVAGLAEADRGGKDPLRGDFVTAHGATLLVDLAPGDYRLELTAGDPDGTADIAVTAAQIAKIAPTAAAQGEILELSFELAHVSEQLALEIGGTAAHLSSLVITPLAPRQRGGRPTAFLLGDSTMQTYDPYWMPQAGWGQFFDRFTTAGLAVDNRSIGGRSSRSFLEQGRLDEVLRLIRPGDVVLVQFGHNDASWNRPERYTPPADYREYLRLYIEGTRQRGGEAIVVTPVSRRDYDAETGLFRVSFPEYVEAAISIAQEMGAPLVDLSASSRAFLDGIGPDAATDVFLHAAPGIYPNRPAGVTDNTHFQEYGAIQMARLVARDVAALDLPISDRMALHASAGVPDPVGGVEATGASASTLELSWPAAADADVYRVHLAPVGEEPVFVGATAGTSFQARGLAEATEHEIRVSAANEHGEGELGPGLRTATAEAIARFDLGPADAPLAEGWTRVSETTRYDAALGHGLRGAEGAISRDRGEEAGGAVARDFVARFDAPYEFVVDLADGAYTLVATVGDALGSARTELTPAGGGTVTVAVDSGSREVVLPAQVVGGQLVLGIGGRTGHLNGLTITPA